MRFKQGKSGFMKRFEGCRKVEPLFVVEQILLPSKSKTWATMIYAPGEKGRVGSVGWLDQLFQLVLVPLPPILW